MAEATRREARPVTRRLREAATRSPASRWARSASCCRSRPATSPTASRRSAAPIGRGLLAAAGVAAGVTAVADQVRRRAKSAARAGEGRARRSCRRAGGGRRRRRRGHVRMGVRGPDQADVGAASWSRTGGAGSRRRSPRSSAGTSSTTGTTGSCTRPATCGRIHVVHHSRERYNLSTALRQPVADVVRHVRCRTALLCLVGIRPSLIEHGPRRQPAVPVLDPHRHDPAARPVRGGAEHAVAPPGAPRQQPAVHRPQPRQHPDRVGPAVRHVRARGASPSSTG